MENVKSLKATGTFITLLYTFFQKKKEVLKIAAA